MEVASTEQPEESISDNRNVKSSVNLQQEENIKTSWKRQRKFKLPTKLSQMDLKRTISKADKLCFSLIKSKIRIIIISRLTYASEFGVFH